jgi:cbb3-type cytochrome oxidase subunit 3
MKSKPYYTERNRKEAEEDLIKVSKGTARFGRAAAATTLAIMALAGASKKPQKSPEYLVLPPLIGYTAYLHRKKAKHNMTWILNDYLATRQNANAQANSSNKEYQNIDIARFNIESLGRTKGSEYTVQHASMALSGFMVGAEYADKIPESAQSSNLLTTVGIFAVGAAISYSDGHKYRMDVSNYYLDLVDKTIGYSTRLGNISSIYLPQLLNNQLI